jgi:hypothetical protein
MGRLLLAIALTMAGAQLALGSTWRVAAQDSGAQVVIERPLPGTSISVQAHISGWAVDPSGPGTGIDAVHVYLDGEPGQPRARFLGQASYGQQRPDVARTLGEDRFTTSGFALLSELPPGTHSLYVYAHSAGAGPQEGWNRASVTSFETSLIEAVATMVQPGPTPAGDTGRYQTGQASWQGGNTCVRYTGAGSCEASIPIGVATGASCIQWNQRGQCTNYVGGTDAASSAPAPPAVRSVPPGGPPSVPTVTSSSAARPPVAAPRAVAPPADAATGAEGESDPGAATAGPPSGALPAAAPPGAAAAAAEEAAPAVRVAAPPPAAPAAVGAVRTSQASGASAAAAAPPPRAAGPAAGAAPTAVIILAPPDGGTFASTFGSSSGPDEAIPADAPAPVADSPAVRATAAALHPTGSAATGVAPLRSGCAMYIGCGGDSASASAPVATRPPVPTSPPIAAVSPAGAGLLGPGLAPSPTPTPTSCPPFGGCGPVAR